MGWGWEMGWRWEMGIGMGDGMEIGDGDKRRVLITPTVYIYLPLSCIIASCILHP